MIEKTIDRWHRFVSSGAAEDLDAALGDDVTFYSPIVYTPQRGRDTTAMYLHAARATLVGGTGESAFRYTKQVLAGDTAVLEFETTIDDKYINGVDIIRCDDSARILEFRVMLRPLQAVTIVHERMRAMLESSPS